MKSTIGIIIIVMLLGCGSTKKLKTGAGTISRDSISVTGDSLLEQARTLIAAGSKIPFRTLSSKAKLEYEDMYGEQPETNVYIRMETGKFIWVSITATFLNIEAARVMVLPDSIIIVNRLEKTIESYPISYISEKVALPLSFDDIQKLISGNVILTKDSLSSAASSQSFLQIQSDESGIENRIFFAVPAMLLARQFIDITNGMNNYSADVLYEDYEKAGDFLFSTLREIMIPAEKQRIKLTFRQYEFNKELSVPFSRPGSYTVK